MLEIRRILVMADEPIAELIDVPLVPAHDDVERVLAAVEDRRDERAIVRRVEPRGLQDRRLVDDPLTRHHEGYSSTWTVHPPARLQAGPRRPRRAVRSGRPGPGS